MSSSSLPSLLHAFRGTLIHSPEYSGGVAILTDHLLGVGANGRIAFLQPYSAEKEKELREKFTLPKEGVRTLKKTQFMIPGFIDTHCHAPQFQFTGTGTDRDLMVWLQTYTFPAEMRMANAEYAKEVYEKLVRAALANGTTSIFYYATIHLEASKILVDTCRTLGQRAFIGKVNMDQYCPDGYRETTEQSLKDTEEFIQYVRSLQSALVTPVITPRFIPTCSLDLLKGLSALAKKYDCWIQSHASESSDQVAFVQSLLPEYGAAPADASPAEAEGLKAGRCTGIFNTLGLLTNKCMMAHGTYLTQPEWNIFQTRGVSIAHCPLSNSFCSDAYLKVKPALANGNKIGLGSDVAGGYSLSILSNLRQSVITSKFHTADITEHPSKVVVIPEAKQRPISQSAKEAQALAKEQADNTCNASTLSYKDAFWLATSGGAEAINMSHELGKFEEGYWFDVQMIDVSPESDSSSSQQYNPIHLFPCDSFSDIFQKFINLGDDRHVSEVYVQGREVKKSCRITSSSSAASSVKSSSSQMTQTQGTEVAASSTQTHGAEVAASSTQTNGTEVAASGTQTNGTEVAASSTQTQ